MTPADIIDWMTTSQAARFLEVSDTRIIHLANADRLAHIRTARGRLFDPDSVRLYAETRRVLHREAVVVTSEDHVYFIQAGDEDGAPIKIGWARSVSKRLGELQMGSPVKLHLLVAIPGGREREQEMHNLFAHARLRGEWFDGADPALCAHIEFFRAKHAA